MEKYWSDQPRAGSTNSSAPSNMASNASILSDYDRYQQSLVATPENEGWAAELRRYLKDMPPDVTKDTDIVEWWQVCPFNSARNTFCLIHPTEPRATLSNTCSHCYRHPPVPSIIRPM